MIRKTAKASRAIHKIKDKKGKIVTDQQDINKCFALFYSELCQSKCNATGPQTMEHFLAECELPNLDRGQLLHSLLG